MKTSTSIALLLFTCTLAQPSFAGALCKTSETFRPNLGICVQVKTGLKWWTEGAKTRLNHSDAKALCESQDMRLPASQELIALAKDGAISAFNVELDEIFWALETTEDQSSHAAVYMSSPDKIALKNDQTASFLCVSGMGMGMGMNFVPVPGQSFEMQETEVTRGQWKALMGYYPEAKYPDCKPNILADDHPVSCVSALDADNFAKEMSRKNEGHTYRLPSDEEWSAAASDYAEGPLYGWCKVKHTHPVKKLNAENGLYDMMGNVAEWTSSTKTAERNRNVVYRIYRGASWATQYLDECNVDHRSSEGSYRHADEREVYIGFRLLRQP